MGMCRQVVSPAPNYGEDRLGEPDPPLPLSMVFFFLTPSMESDARGIKVASGRRHSS